MLILCVPFWNKIRLSENSVYNTILLMKTIPFFIIGFSFLLASLSLKGQTTQQSTIQPTIMVIPFAKEQQQLRTVLEQDGPLRVAVTKIKEGFDDRGYSTIDFRAKLNQLNNDKVMELENQNSIKQELIELSGADIYVEVEVQKTRSSSGNSATIVMTAFDAFSGKSLSNKVCTSPKFYSDDFVKLTEKALGTTVEEFLNTIQLKFDDIVENGRSLTMNVTFSENSEFDMDSELGDDLELLSDIIEDWLTNNAYKSYYHVQGITATKMIIDEIKVPLKDEKGRNFRTSKFASNFRKFLAGKGLKSSRDIQGSKIFITIL